jgi:glycosyltransferase involved in cell wall biosynthesis
VRFSYSSLSLDRGLIACAEAISEERNWEFHLYGQGELSKTLISESFRNVFVHQSIPHEELMTIASRSNLFLLMYDPSFEHNKFTASNKLFEAAQLGLPILTNDGTSVGSLTVQANLGWSITYNDAAEIRRVLWEVGKISLVSRDTLKANLYAFYKSQKTLNDAEMDKIRVKVRALLGGSV